MKRLLLPLQCGCCHRTLSFLNARASAKDTVCCLFLQRKDSVVWKLAARWPGHPYRWPSLAKTSKHPPNPLRRRRISTCKMTGSALSEVSLDSAKRRLTKKENYWSSEELIITSVGLWILRFLTFTAAGKGLVRAFPSWSWSSLKDWRDAGRTSRESNGFSGDGNMTPTWLSVWVQRNSLTQALLATQNFPKSKWWLS